MRRHEFENWATTPPADCVYVDDTPLKQMHFYAMPLGEALRAYVEHLGIPWWRRVLWSGEWKEVEAKLREILNDERALVWFVRQQ